MRPLSLVGFRAQGNPALTHDPCLPAQVHKPLPSPTRAARGGTSHAHAPHPRPRRSAQVKNVKPRKEGEQGQQKKLEFPIHHSNVMLYSKEKGVRSRVGHKVVDGKKVRFLVKTGEVLP